MTLGWTDGKGTNTGSYWNHHNGGSMYHDTNSYGLTLPDGSANATPYANCTVMGVTTDPNKSGLIGSLKDVDKLAATLYMKY